MKSSNLPLRATRRPAGLLIFLLLFLSVACGGSGESSADAGAAEAPALSADSLRRAYRALMQERAPNAFPTKAIVEAGKLYPEDQAPLDTAFFVFRENLLRAVDRQDAFALLEVVAADVKVGFGGEDGTAAFVEAWQLTSPEKITQSPIWAVLGGVLRGGGAFQDGGRRFVAPYVYANWPENVDAFRHLAITGEGVRLRPAPSTNSRITTMVNYDIVESLGLTTDSLTIDGERYPWAHIRTAGGEEGYVWGKFAASPIGYRAGFERRDGRWKLVFLVSGD